MNIKPVSRRQELVIQKIENELLVYDLKTNKAHHLTETAAYIWQHCDGNNSISDLKALVEKKFNTKINEDFIWLALDQLNRENLLEGKIASHGISRREVLKKIGVAAMVALPIVASLSVPNTALATSTCGNVCSPTSPKSCAPGCTCVGSICR